MIYEKNMKLNNLFGSIIKLSILMAPAIYSQSAIADECPVKYNPDGLEIINAANSDPEKIYFCAQNFNATSRTFQPSSADIVQDGSQTISKGATIQTMPLSNSINLSGFTLDDLQFRLLTKKMPVDESKTYPDSLFNFYTRLDRPSGVQCYRRNQYEYILDYLRSHPSIFKAGGKPAVTNSTGNNIATIYDAVLTNSNGHQLKANITFEYINNSNSGQFFTEKGKGVMCWVGVGTTFTIKPDNTLKQAGAYDITLSIN